MFGLKAIHFGVPLVLFHSVLIANGQMQQPQSKKDMVPMASDPSGINGSCHQVSHQD